MIYPKITESINNNEKYNEYTYFLEKYKDYFTKKR